MEPRLAETPRVAYLKTSHLTVETRNPSDSTTNTAIDQMRSRAIHWQQQLRFDPNTNRVTRAEDCEDFPVHTAAVPNVYCELPLAQRCIRKVY